MPDARRSSFTVALLATPAAMAGTIFGYFDMLACTRRDWTLLHSGDLVQSPFILKVVSRDGLPFVNFNGVRVTPDASLEDCPQPDIVCISDMLEAPWADIATHYGPEIDWLRGAWEGGATLCSACSGALLLAQTGLLDGLEATSHWAFCDYLAKAHPRTRWSPERTLVVTGPDQRLMMAGSGTSWYMLGLALIARFVSPKEAMQVARVMLLSSTEVSSVAYSSLTRGMKQEDPLIERCQVWAADNYRVESPVTQLVALSGLPERTFKRRFTLATGMSPMEYIHTLRLEEAKQQLETTDLPVEAVAVEVGYQDASFFNRLFRRKVHLTPAGYRRRFGALSKQLQLVSSGPAVMPPRSPHGAGH